MKLNWRVIILWDLVSRGFLSFLLCNISRPKTNKICGYQKYLFFHLFLFSQSSMSFFTVIVERRCPEYRTKSNIAFWNFGKWIFLSEEKLFTSFGRFKGFLIYCHSVSVSIFIEKWWLMMQFILQKCDHFHHLYFKSQKIQSSPYSLSSPTANADICTRFQNWFPIFHVHNQKKPPGGGLSLLSGLL